MKRFSLQSLLLLVTLVCVCVGWYVESSRRPELIYLHIYSTRYRYNYVPHDADWDRNDPAFKQNARIATVAFRSGVDFCYHLGDHYDPMIDIEGNVTQRGQECFGNISLQFNAPDLANDCNPTTPLAMDRLYPLDLLVGTFHFALSNSPDPYSLDYRLPLQDGLQPSSDRD